MFAPRNQCFIHVILVINVLSTYRVIHVFAQDILKQPFGKQLLKIVSYFTILVIIFKKTGGGFQKNFIRMGGGCKKRFFYLCLVGRE